MTYSRTFIEKLPKTDLHVHLDGSLRPATLLELADEQGVTIPVSTVEELDTSIFKDAYKDLVEYLQGFSYTVAVMQTGEALERVAYEFAQDNFNEGVRYFEVRFAPQLHINQRLSMEDIFIAINTGLKRAADEFNARPEIKSGEEPPVRYGIIACAMRAVFPGMSEYYDSFLRVHSYLKKKRVYSLASLELAHAIVQIRDTHNIPIVGIDIAGPEDGYPPDDHQEAFSIAHQHFFNKTVHAGEAYGPESIFQAITLLHADRIGHGYYLFADHKVSSDIENPKEYVQHLAEYIGHRRITIEVCLTSNMQTNPEIKDVAQHEFCRMKEAKLSTTLCTDNRTVSKTTMTDEIQKAVNVFDLTPKELRNVIVYGFKRSFFAGTYNEKRNYVRQMIDYYEKCEREELGRIESE